jgi:hypothetical protein
MSSYPLRLPDHVLEEARRAAAEDNVSLNQLLSSLIADGIGHRRAVLALRRRAERGDTAAAVSVLDKVPANVPDPGDTLA